MKLPNGYGWCSKLGGNRRRPWAVRITVGWTDEGKQMYKYLGYYKTKAEALQALAEYHRDPSVLSKNPTLSEVTDEWRQSVAYTKLADATRHGYEAAWAHLSSLHEHPHQRNSDVSSAGCYRPNGGPGLAYASCHKVKVLASILMKRAMADDIIQQNYASLVTLPQKEKKKVETFTDLEIRAITRLAETDVWAGTILIMIYTGMRVGELLTLRKSNVDMRHHLITGGIKTDAGKNRVVPISPKILSYVQYWYDQPGEYLITRDGQPISDDYYRKHLYYPALEHAGVRGLRRTKHVTPSVPCLIEPACRPNKSRNSWATPTTQPRPIFTPIRSWNRFEKQLQGFSEHACSIRVIYKNTQKPHCHGIGLFTRNEQVVGSIPTASSIIGLWLQSAITGFSFFRLHQKAPAPGQGLMPFALSSALRLDPRTYRSGGRFFLFAKNESPCLVREARGFGILPLSNAPCWRVSPGTFVSKSRYIISGICTYSKRVARASDGTDVTKPGQTIP